MSRRPPPTTSAAFLRPGRRPGRVRTAGACGRAAGFTLLEVTLATFVMALGIATSILALQNGFRHLDLARGTTIAAQILQSEMERIRMMSFGGVSALPESATFDGALNFSPNSRVARTFLVTRTRTPDAARPGDVMHIGLAVSWRTYDGRSHTRALNSIYSKNGLYDYYYTIAHP